MSYKQLAAEAGITIGYLSMLETGQRQGTVAVLTAIAKTLSVPIDNLVLSEGEA